MTLEHQYLSLCNSILNNGYTKNTRNGSTKSIFGFTLRHNMADGFPLLTTKKVDYKNIVSELLWFLRGDTNIKYLLDHNNNIWVGDCYKRYKNITSLEWEKGHINELYEEGLIVEENVSASEYKLEQITYRFLTEKEFIEKIKTDSIFAEIWGDIGPGYGAQFRNSTNIDQISNLINDLKNNPDSRRLLVSAWNVGELDAMLLPPCHYSFQCYTRELTREERWNHLRSLLVNFPSNIRIPWDSMNFPSHEWLDDVLLVDVQSFLPHSKVEVPRRSISLIWNQRSVDVPLGLPFNIASYATLLTILGKLTNMVPETLIGNLGDCHIYSNQIEGIKEQLTRFIFPSPKLSVNSENWTCVEDINPLDFKIEDYESHPRIYFPLSN